MKHRPKETTKVSFIHISGCPRCKGALSASLIILQKVRPFNLIGQEYKSG
jgi:hypothetical protein